MLNINKQLYNLKSLFPYKDVSVHCPLYKNENLIENENFTTNKSTAVKPEHLGHVQVKSCVKSDIYTCSHKASFCHRITYSSSYKALKNPVPVHTDLEFCVITAEAYSTNIVARV